MQDVYCAKHLGTFVAPPSFPLARSPPHSPFAGSLFSSSTSPRRCANPCQCCEPKIGVACCFNHVLLLLILSFFQINLIDRRRRAEHLGVYHRHGCLWRIPRHHRHRHLWCVQTIRTPIRGHSRRLSGRNLQ